MALHQWFGVQPCDATTMLARADHRQLSRDINDAACTVQNGHIAWQQGAFGPENVTGLVTAQVKLAQHLADHEDKRLVLCDETLSLMRYYEQMAADLLEGIAALNAPDRIEERIKSPTGSWIMSRRFVLDNEQHEHAVVCTNPAVCSRELDEWETSVRAAAPLMRDAA